MRKRICMHVYKKASLTGRLLKKFVGSDSIIGTSVYYDVVAHIPKSSMDVEDRTSLARMAAQQSLSSDDDSSSSSGTDDRWTNF
ncbi:unnamed protein product [Gongylonema pulchrum]|uniref:Uncharacterized protein n=1 Tax=Gongylonema pulchrum TaxID=637853 RepID=A0A3P7QVN8_9BILA|nr:unnamed protein product [Gongylonema pulchrum]